MSERKNKNINNRDKTSNLIRIVSIVILNNKLKPKFLNQKSNEDNAVPKYLKNV